MVINLGKITQKEADIIAYEYSDKQKGNYVLYPEFEGEEECFLVAEFNEDDELIYGKIYTKEDLPKNIR
jgi:hypothetical protein